MERRFETRRNELLQEAVVDDALLTGMLSRLEEFVVPFARSLCRREQRENAEQYVAGLVSDLGRKNVESIAYHHDQERQALQKFIGSAGWDHQPLLMELARQIGTALGEADGVLVFDPSAFPKTGKGSVGVQRQWCGRLGKVDNCQVGVFLGYVSRKEHALVDMRLYLPKSWAKDRKRRRKAGVPKETRFCTRHQLALQMLEAKGSLLPHTWIAGDDEMGRSTRFRRDLDGLKERYLLGVPSNTLVRHLDAAPPPYCGRGPRPQVPFVRADRWRATLPAEAWETIDVRDGDKGPLVVQAVKARVAAKTDRRRAGPEEILVVIREQQDDGEYKHDYYLSNEIPETPLTEFARVAKAEHRIEECLERAKGEAGLAGYQVRNWLGWHHHQTLSLIATWFLTQETQRGKKINTGTDNPTSSLGSRPAAAWSTRLWPARADLPQHDPSPQAQRGSTTLSLENT
jgi:SRSO17 transposase